jgi:hypothetical protein
MCPIVSRWMRWFIASFSVQKFKGFAYPRFFDTGTNPDSFWMKKDLSQNVIDFASTFIFETDVELRVCVSEEVH